MVTLINVSLENHPGSMAEILAILAKAEINVDAVEAEAQGDFGVVKLLTSKARLAMDLLRQDGYDVVEAEYLEVLLDNKHGELARVAKRLADGGVNVVSLFGTTPPGSVQGRILIRVNDPAKAKKVLGLA